MIHCMTTDQMNDSGRHGHKQNFAKSHCKLKTWAKFATERLHTMSAHVMFFLRYLLMLPLKVIVLLVGLFPAGKNNAMPVGIVPQVKVNCCFFPLAVYPNLQYSKCYLNKNSSSHPSLPYIRRYPSMPRNSIVVLLPILASSSDDERIASLINASIPGDLHLATRPKHTPFPLRAHHRPDDTQFDK